MGSASDGVPAGTTQYCDSLDVSKFLFGDKKGDFSDTTKPKKTTVDNIINRVEDQIERLTRHAWRTKTVANEYHDYEGITKRRVAYPRGHLPCRCVFLKHRKIHAFVSGTHKIEIWDGDEWIDLALTANGYTEGREGDYWINYQKGIIYFEDEEPEIGKDKVRVTYAYGETTVPGDIEEWAIKQTAIDLIYSEDWTVMTIDNTERVALESKVEHWKDDIKQIRDAHEEPIIA